MVIERGVSGNRLSEFVRNSASEAVTTPKVLRIIARRLLRSDKLMMKFPYFVVEILCEERGIVEKVYIMAEKDQDTSISAVVGTV